MVLTQTSQGIKHDKESWENHFWSSGNARYVQQKPQREATTSLSMALMLMASIINQLEMKKTDTKEIRLSSIQIISFVLCMFPMLPLTPQTHRQEKEQKLYRYIGSKKGWQLRNLQNIRLKTVVLRKLETIPPQRQFYNIIYIFHEGRDFVTFNSVSQAPRIVLGTQKELNKDVLMELSVFVPSCWFMFSLVTLNDTSFVPKGHCAMCISFTS